MLRRVKIMLTRYGIKCKDRARLLVLDYFV